MDNFAAFLRAFAPRSVCPDCLAKLIHEDAASVAEHMNTETAAGRIEVARACSRRLRASCQRGGKVEYYIPP